MMEEVEEAESTFESRSSSGIDDPLAEAFTSDTSLLERLSDIDCCCRP